MLDWLTDCSWIFSWIYLCKYSRYSNVVPSPRCNAIEAKAFENEDSSRNCCKEIIFSRLDLNWLSSSCNTDEAGTDEVGSAKKLGSSKPSQDTQCVYGFEYVGLFCNIIPNDGAWIDNGEVNRNESVASNNDGTNLFGSVIPNENNETLQPTWTMISQSSWSCPVVSEVAFKREQASRNSSPPHS